MHSALGLFDLTPLNPNLIRQHNRQDDGVDNPMCRYQVVKQVHLVCLFCRDIVLFTMDVAGHWRGEEHREIRGNNGHTLNFSAMLLDVQKWMFPLLVSISPWKGLDYSNSFFFFCLHPWELGALCLWCPTRLCVWQSAEPLMVSQCNASWTYSGMYVNCYLQQGHTILKSSSTLYQVKRNHQKNHQAPSKEYYRESCRAFYPTCSFYLPCLGMYADPK